MALVGIELQTLVSVSDALTTRISVSENEKSFKCITIMVTSTFFNHLTQNFG